MVGKVAAPWWSSLPKHRTPLRSRRTQPPRGDPRPPSESSHVRTCIALSSTTASVHQARLDGLAQLLRPAVLKRLQGPVGGGYKDRPGPGYRDPERLAARS